MQKRTRLDRLKAWARGLKRDMLALWLAARDPEVPLPAKLVAGLVAAYTPSRPSTSSPISFRYSATWTISSSCPSASCSP